MLKAGEGYLNTISGKNKVCAVIPFFNEFIGLRKVILDTLPFVDNIILIDDGSVDGSSETIPDNEKIILLTHKKNTGKGAAIKSGLEESIKRGFDISVTLDADLQHPPECIPEFISSLDNFDIVVGNRLGDLKKMPLQRIISNKLTTFILRLKTKVDLKDTQCGFRAFRNGILSDILPDFPGYEAESEMLIKAAKKNFRIGFIPVPTIYAGEKSKLKPVKTIIGFLRILFI